jgi:hypothetical protein
MEVPGASSGLHKRQGRYPARSASAAVGKKVQFSAFGCFALHTGRQYIPVDNMPTKNRPSKRASFALNAAYRALSFSVIAFAPPFVNHIIFHIKIRLFSDMIFLYFHTKIKAVLRNPELP